MSRSNEIKARSSNASSLGRLIGSAKVGKTKRMVAGIESIANLNIGDSSCLAI
jgi:hypothetical protein